MKIKSFYHILAALTSKDERAKTKRVIGGTEANPRRHSYAVSLVKHFGSIYCGGSLIAPDVVLSAAHCAGGSYAVLIGTHDLNSGEGDEVEVSREIVHPSYETKSEDNDFMVLILTRPTTASVSQVELNSDPNIPEAGAQAFVLGWGDTTADDSIKETSDVLLKVGVTVISNEACEEVNGKYNGKKIYYDGWITENMLCAIAKNQDACQGDSGGPLVLEGDHDVGNDDILVGVVSWGIGCATNIFPGVYARVSSQYHWIRDQVCQHSSDPPPSFQCDDQSIQSVRTG